MSRNYSSAVLTMSCIADVPAMFRRVLPICPLGLWLHSCCLAECCIPTLLVS